MTRARRPAPGLDLLEGRRLLSTAVHRPASTPPLVLDGSLHGASSSIVVNDGPTTTVTESFSGRVRALGAVKATISDEVDSTGHLLGGGIVLKNARGSVHLAFTPGDLVSSTTSGTVKTEVVDYAVASSTGAYARASGAGSFTLIETADLTSELILKSG